MARILVVDDEAEVLGVLESVLHADHHVVTTACDGRAALATIAAGSFDLVITDLLMPVMEGIEMIMELRRTSPELKVIAMSGGGRGGTGDYLAIASRCGATGTLAKPFSTHSLLAIVHSVLGD